MRTGGVSPDPFRSLNFIASSGDDPANVAENRARAGAFLGVDAGRIYYLSQGHGTGVEFVRGSEDAAEVVHRRGDAVASDSPRAACGVRSADCGTLLVGDPKTGAACAIHAGWKGTVLGVVPAAIAAMRSAFGSDPRSLVVAVGPHIEVCCFEVGGDVARELAGCSPAGEAVVVRDGEKKPHVDLRAVLVAQLVAAGVEALAIDHVRGCTVCDRERFFSYRREGQVSGRLLSAIVPRVL